MNYWPAFVTSKYNSNNKLNQVPCFGLDVGSLT